MKFLILSFRAGEGHLSAARAIKERAEAEGHSAEIIDYFSFYSEKTSKKVDESYVRLVRRAPFLFGIGYNVSLAIGNAMWKMRLGNASKVVSRPVAKKVWDYMRENGPYDGCIATHVLSAEVFSLIKEEHPEAPKAAFVATDYATYPFFEGTHNCDYYVIPSEDLREPYKKQGAEDEKIRVYGIPTDARFQNLLPKEEAREKLGLSQEKKYFLLMGGSMGAGNLVKLVKKLYKKTEYDLIVICGRNEKLKQTLEKKFPAKEGEERVHAVGFTKEIPAYMRACDVLYTKPGGLSSSEAMVCGTPLVHTAPIPGCESGNFKYFRRHRLSLTEKRLSGQVTAGKRLMSDEALVADMLSQQKKHQKGDATKRIISLFTENDAQ